MSEFSWYLVFGLCCLFSFLGPEFFLNDNARIKAWGPSKCVAILMAIFFAWPVYAIYMLWLAFQPPTDFNDW